jgi:hypothetical protein
MSNDPFGRRTQNARDLFKSHAHTTKTTHPSRKGETEKDDTIFTLGTWHVLVAPIWEPSHNPFCLINDSPCLL